MQLVPVLLSLTSVWQKYRTTPSTSVGLRNIWRTLEVPHRSACGQDALRDDCSVPVKFDFFFSLFVLLVENNICSRLFGGMKENFRCKFFW